MEHGRNRTWDEELRSHGYRVTPQRQLVLEAVARLDHATPEAIAASVQQTVKGVNISTIYRTLELLDSLGLVTHTHLNHGAPTYHLASAAGHVHLVCQGCGKINEADQETIGRRPEVQPEGYAQCVALRRRQPLDRTREEPQQPVQGRITERGLRFDARDACRGHPPCSRRL